MEKYETPERQEAIVDAVRADLLTARLMLATLSAALGYQGWCASMYGSTLLAGEGRDVDILLLRQDPEGISLGEVLEQLKLLGIETIIHDRRWRMHGIVGLWHERVVDITLVALT